MNYSKIMSEEEDSETLKAQMLTSLQEAMENILLPTLERYKRETDDKLENIARKIQHTNDRVSDIEESRLIQKSPQGSVDANPRNELPPAGEKPVIPQPSAGKNDEPNNADLLANISQLFNNRLSKDQKQRRATILNKVEENEVLNETFQKGIMQVLIPDYNDLPTLPKLTHPNQLIRFARKANLKLVEKKAPLEMGTRLGQEIRNGIVHQNVGLTPEDVLKLPFPKLLELLYKYIKPRTQGQAVQWLMEVEFPKVLPPDGKTRTDAVYLRDVFNAFLTYRDDFDEMIGICSKYTSHFMPITTLRENGLLWIFLRQIPDGYGFRLFEEAQKWFRINQNNPAAKLEYRDFELIADIVANLMSVQVTDLESNQATLEVVKGPAKDASKQGFAHQNSPASKPYEKRPQAPYIKPKPFGHRVHFMDADYEENELSAINPAEQEDEYYFDKSYDELTYEDAKSEEAYEGESPFDEESANPDEATQVHMVRSIQKRVGPPTAKPAPNPDEKRDYDRSQYSNGAFKPRPQQKDSSTQACFNMMTFGNCKKDKCGYSHDEAVLEASSLRLMESLRRKLWLKSNQN